MHDEIPCSFMQRLDTAAGKTRKAEEGRRKAVGVILGMCKRDSAPFLLGKFMGRDSKA